VAALGFTSAAHGVINMDFVYDGTDTVASYTGLWEGVEWYEAAEDSSINAKHLHNYSQTFGGSGTVQQFLNLTDTYYRMSHGGLTGTIPWDGSHAADAGSGTPWGFDGTYFYSNEADSASGSLTFLGKSLSDLGFTIGEVNGSFGTDGEPEMIQWTATTVPERATTPGTLGVVALTSVMIRRRRR
jgi:hypothetical protein